MLELAIKAAKNAGQVLMENLGKVEAHEIDTKNQFDFVSFVDKQAEEKVINTIKAAYPDHKFFGEESLKDDSGGYRWIIDPLDGTTNYLHHLPIFSVSIGLEKDGEIILGVVYNPYLDELFTAEKGNGAFLNGKPISVSDIDDPGKAMIATGFPFRIKDDIDPYMRSLRSVFFDASGIRRMGSAAVDLCYVACGRFEGFWEIGLSLWDIAAGYLILTEAGGKMCDFKGENDFLKSGNVVATNAHLYEFLLKKTNADLAKY